MEFNKENFKKLEHHYDTTVGLWATDKNPIDTLTLALSKPGLNLENSQKDEIIDAFANEMISKFFQISG